VAVAAACWTGELGESVGMAGDELFKAYFGWFSSSAGRVMSLLP
jgi:hypothetical protein